MSFQARAASNQRRTPRQLVVAFLLTVEAVWMLGSVVAMSPWLVIDDPERPGSAAYGIGVAVLGGLVIATLFATARLVFVRESWHRAVVPLGLGACILINVAVFVFAGFAVGSEDRAFGVVLAGAALVVAVAAAAELRSRVRVASCPDQVTGT